MTDNTWLSELKVGDPVFIENNSMGESLTRTKVAKLTKHTIVVELYDQKFSRSGGYTLVQWGHTKLVQDTPESNERAAAINLYKAAYRMVKAIHIPNKRNDIVRLIEAIRPFTTEQP